MVETKRYNTPRIQNLDRNTVNTNQKLQFLYTFSVKSILGNSIIRWLQALRPEFGSLLYYNQVSDIKCWGIAKIKITFQGLCVGTHWVEAALPELEVGTDPHRPLTCKSGTGCTSWPGPWSGGRSGPRGRTLSRRKRSEIRNNKQWFQCREWQNSEISN